MAQARRAVGSRWDILLAVSAGGALGAAARWGMEQALPLAGEAFPWATFLVNVSGCFALGLLMVFVVDVWSSSRYLRPFLGVGLLGGYTTFSTYALETRSLLATGRQDVAGLYLFGSLAAGLAAVWLGIVGGRLTLLGAATVRRRRVRRARDRRRRSSATEGSRSGNDTAPAPAARRTR